MPYERETRHRLRQQRPTAQVCSYAPDRQCPVCRSGPSRPYPVLLAQGASTALHPEIKHQQPQAWYKLCKNGGCVLYNRLCSVCAYEPATACPVLTSRATSPHGTSFIRTASPSPT
eukprot:1536388-Rhodomonas_salina.1